MKKLTIKDMIIYGVLTIDALKEMQDLGFFDGAATFTN